jgi:hypothetical protein
METNRSGFGYGRGFHNTASMSENSVVVAPIPSANIKIVAAAKAGRRLSDLQADFQCVM